METKVLNVPTKRKLEGSENEESQRQIPKPCGDEIINKSASATDAKGKCDECKWMIPTLDKLYSEKNRLYMHVRSDTLYGIPGSKTIKNEEFVRFKLEFLQLVCSLRNSSGGVLFIHVQDRNKKFGRSLDKFDERFEEELSRMIEDDSMYHKNYTKRDWVSLENEKYEDYIVMFIEGSKSVSTQDYNTFMPHFGQNVRPKAREMAKYINEITMHRREVSKPSYPKFEEEKTLELLYESVNKEFKRLDEHDLKAYLDMEDDRPAAVVNCIVGLKLYEYITSFTKLDDGGVIYIGIEEQKLPMDQLQVTKKESGLVQTRSEVRNDHFNRDDKKKLFPSFHYVVKGIQLDPPHLKRIKKGLYHKIKTEMLWLMANDRMMTSDELEEEVKIQFHKTTDREQSPEKYVIEVCVLRQFPGVVFTKKYGPNVYMTKEGKICTVEVLKWKEKILSTKA